MGRKKINDYLLKKVISVRLSQLTIDEIDKIGKRQSIIEEAIKLYLKLKQNDEK